MEKKKLIAVLIAIVVWFTGYIIGHNHIPEVTKMVQIDTLIVRDTHIIERPVMVEKTVKETLLVSVHDTTRIHDTLYIALPKETKTYKGEDYLAQVSGYQPSLDLIEVYPKTTTITKTETNYIEPSLWVYSLSLGVDYGKSDLQYIAPNIGTEIGYSRWSLSGELGCSLDIQGDMTLTPSLYYQVGLRFRFLGK